MQADAWRYMLREWERKKEHARHWHVFQGWLCMHACMHAGIYTHTELLPRHRRLEAPRCQCLQSWSLYALRCPFLPCFPEGLPLLKEVSYLTNRCPSRGRGGEGSARTKGELMRGDRGDRGTHSTPRCNVRKAHAHYAKSKELGLDTVAACAKTHESSHRSRR